MDEQREQLNQLKEIRDLMERSSRFLSLSGLSGIFAGIFALIGALVALWYFDFDLNFLNKHDKIYTTDNVLRLDFLVFVFAVAISVLFMSVLFAVIFSIRNSKKKGLNFWDKSAYRVLANMMIPLSTGGLLILIMIFQNNVFYAAGLTMIFYGLALINTSKYTFNDIRYLGIFELGLGLLACIFVGYGLLFWAVGFGVMHIIYGSVMYFKYER